MKLKKFEQNNPIIKASKEENRVEKEWIPEKIGYSDFDLVRKETNPLEIDEEGSIVLGCKGEVDIEGESFNRLTKHFTLNEVVEDVQAGLDVCSWDSAHSVYISDMETFNRKNQKEPVNILPSDTFYIGDTKLPEGATIVTVDPKVADKIDGKKYKVIFNPEWNKLSEEEKAKTLDAEAYKVLQEHGRKKIPKEYLNDSGHFNNDTIKKAFSDFCQEKNISCGLHVYHWTNSFEGGSPDGLGHYVDKVNALQSLIRRRKNEAERGGIPYVMPGMTMPPDYFRKYVGKFDKNNLIGFLKCASLDNIFEELSLEEKNVVIDRMQELFGEEEWRSFLVNNQYSELDDNISNKIFESIKNYPELCSIVADTYPLSDFRKKCFAKCPVDIKAELLDYLEKEEPNVYQELQDL